MALLNDQLIRAFVFTPGTVNYHPRSRPNVVPNDKVRFSCSDTVEATDGTILTYFYFTRVSVYHGERFDNRLPAKNNISAELNLGFSADYTFVPQEII